MPVAEITVLPLGTPGTSVSSYIADCVKVLQATRLQYELTPSGTIIEGELSELMDVMGRMHEAPFDNGVLRVYTVIKIDDRRDKPLTMMDKVTAVQEKL